MTGWVCRFPEKRRNGKTVPAVRRYNAGMESGGKRHFSEEPDALIASGNVADREADGYASSASPVPFAFPAAPSPSPSTSFPPTPSSLAAVPVRKPASASARKLTPLFAKYVANLAVRLALFAWGLFLLFASPDQLDPAHHFGISQGFSFVNVVFLFVLLDGLSKLSPSAKIAMGSLKQYRTFHAPTARTFMGGRDELLAYMGRVRDDGAAIARETAVGVRETAQVLVREIDILRLLPRDERDLTADEKLRDDIRRCRTREIVPVAVFWVLANAAIALVLNGFGVLGAPVAMVWMLFYFLFDMVCVVAWCPLQLFLMRNRCCTTCQIFNWDAIMAATPLLFVGGWFSAIIMALALVVLLRWELAFVRHPERFDERTNASLKCSNCQDSLCYVRKPLKAKEWFGSKSS